MIMNYPTKPNFVTVNLNELDFPEYIKNSSLYKQLLENKDDDIIVIDNKYLSFNSNNIIELIDIYRYWMVEEFDFYDMINSNINIVFERIQELEHIFEEHFILEIKALIQYNKIVMYHNMIVNNTIPHYLGEPISNESILNDKNYYFNEPLHHYILNNSIQDVSLNIKYHRMINTCIHDNFILKFNREKIDYFSHYLMKNNLINIFIYFHNRGYLISNDICVMAARDNNFEAFKFFHEKGYKLKYSLDIILNKYYFDSKLDFVKYCIENKCDVFSNIDKVLTLTVEKNDITTLKYLWEYIKNHNITIDINNPTNVYSLLFYAASNQNIECIDYIVNEMGYIVKIYDLNSSILSSHTNIECMKKIHKYMVEQNFNFNRNNKCEIFRYMCMEYQEYKRVFFIDVIDYLYKNNIYIDDTIYNQCLFNAPYEVLDMFMMAISRYDNNIIKSRIVDEFVVILNHINFSAIVENKLIPIAVKHKFPFSKFSYYVLMKYNSNKHNLIKLINENYDTTIYCDILNQNIIIKENDRNIFLDMK